MREYRFRPTLRRLVVIPALCVLAACGRGADVATSTGLGGGSAPQASTTSTTHLRDSDGESDHAERTGDLTPARMAELGLLDAGRAAPVTDQLWSNPQAVAARLVLVDTTYSASEDPAALNARRAAYATPRLAGDLAESSSGGARLEHHRHRSTSNALALFIRPYPRLSEWPIPVLPGTSSRHRKWPLDNDKSIGTERRACTVTV